ncbi:hypothetical protein GCM10023322_39580 [Rugosimonospora acidiphila]|uniref:Exo-alpha-sialidase n=1 Tax=Rugosimonospora acidiphila TaxID=556531 RepID=A0ABP9RY98_9ACTN
MPELDFSGLVDEVRAAYKPHFAEVTRRAARRRARVRTAGVAAVAVVALGAAGLVTGTGHAPADSGRPSPYDSSAPFSMAPEFEAGDLNHLYITYLAQSQCELGKNCSYILAASADQGATWRREPIPIPSDRQLFSVIPLSPTTLLVSYKTANFTDPHASPAGDGYLASTDAGRTWHLVDVHTVNAIPSGWQPLEVPSDASPLVVGVAAASPATGAVVRLAPDVVPNPAMYAPSLDTRQSTTAGLWISGLLVPLVPPGSTVTLTTQGPDGTTVNPGIGVGTVSVSHNGGRTWDNHTFTGTDTEYRGQPVTPLFATYDGRTAYVALPKNGAEVVYRSTDGGASWTAGGTVDTGTGGDSVAQLTVRPDGTLVALLSTGYIEYGSTDGGRTFHRLTESHPNAYPIPGGYADLVPEDTRGPDGVVSTSYPAVWLSPDHTHWTRVALNP